MLNDFYTAEVLEDSRESMTAAVSFNAAHEIFAGHFPSQPVVPGVCTMAIVKALLEGAVATPLVLAVASSVKFLRLILPSDAPKFILNWSAIEDGFSLSVHVLIEDSVALKMSAQYARKPLPALR